MDPDETLRQLQALADRILIDDSDAHDAVRLAQLVAALDGWLTAGGFPPAAWASAQGPR